MLTYDEVSALPVVATCSRPDGYCGARVDVRLVLIGTAIVELWHHGFHRCPAVYSAADANELNWLVDNHPNFKSYRRI